MRNIRERTTIINDIAFKSKMLSFNASIEAAVAGPHGVGFAVVTDEIVKMANASEAAAIEINKLLESSLREVEDVVSVNEGRTASALTVSHECKWAFAEIANSMSTIQKATTEIKRAGETQEGDAEKTYQAMAEINTTSSHLTATSELVNHHARTGRAQGKLMIQMVNDLQVLLNGEFKDSKESA
jgi:methyl-accepting chemotaxis protein